MELLGTGDFVGFAVPVLVDSPLFNEFKEVALLREVVAVAGFNVVVAFKGLAVGVATALVYLEYTEIFFVTLSKEALQPLKL